MEKREWIVRAIRRETGDVSSLLLQPADGKPCRYKAGQFLTFMFKHPDGEIRRSYSFASTPGIDNDIFITVKRVPNGEISRQLLDHAYPGMILESLPPSGLFILPESLPAYFFLVAAGVGITPVFSLLKEMLHRSPDTSIRLFYQCRDEENVLFKKELDDLASRYPQFSILYLFSRPLAFGSPTRRLSNFLLEELLLRDLPNLPGALFYLCGPQAFMRMAQFTLRQMNIRPEQIRKENFTIDVIPPAPLMTDRSEKKLMLIFQGHAHRLSLHYPATILDEMIRHRIPMPYSCRGGRCGTCVATCLKGKVKHSINEVLTEEDLRKGLILTCVGYAETDLVLQYPPNPANA